MTNNMIDMAAFKAAYPQFAAAPYAEAALAEHVGKRVRYLRPADMDRKEWVRQIGTLAAKAEYEIVGIQRFGDGSLGFRVRCLAYDDTFGRCMKPSEARFLGSKS